VNLLDHMRIFVFVARFNSFSAAAKALNLTLPTVSRSVSRLEGHLNTELVSRTTRRLALTGAGRAFFHKCSDIIIGVEEAVHAATDSNVLPEGHLRIHACSDIGKHYLIPAIAEYRREHPEVTVDLTLENRLPDLTKEHFDVSISVLPSTDPQLASRNIGATYSVMCASTSYLSRHPIPKVPEDLAQHECLNPLEEAANALDIWTFEGPYGPVNIYLPPSSFHLNSRDAILESIRSGLGIGCVPAFMVAEYLKSGELVRVLPDYHLESYGIHAIYPQSLNTNVCVRSWVNHLASSFPKRLVMGNGIHRNPHLQSVVA
jgi:DNA-binding transcriptional LysR family regulator